MEKFLLKTSIYSFVCSLAAGILLIPKSYMTQDINGDFSAFEKTWDDYIFQILRFAILAAIIIIILALLYKLQQKSELQKMTVAYLILLAIIGIINNLFTYGIVYGEGIRVIVNFATVILAFVTIIYNFKELRNKN